MYFKARYEYGQHQLMPACSEADALMELMKRGYITDSELVLVGKMGFDVFVAGDNKQLGRELKRREIEVKINNGIIEYEQPES